MASPDKVSHPLPRSPWIIWMTCLQSFADLVGTQAGDVSMSDDRMEGCLGAHRGSASLILPEETPLHLFSLN